MSIMRRPEWLQKKISPSAHSAMNLLLEDLQLHTVCREAHCPNISECYGNNQATFLILGTICTRLCSFCNVTKRDPVPPDPDEPRRVAEAIQRLHLHHVVITSPTRDDLPDGGAGLYAETVQEIRAASPDTTVELLIPDFQGNRVNLATVVAAHPEILGHNVETVPRLYYVREGADYRRSLRVLQLIVEMDAAVRSKSGLMLGMGETEDEVVQVCADLLAAGCRYLSIGQYLAPSKNHFPVQEYLPPETFDRYREQALAMGFRHVESGPYVRSSYLADKYGE
ncbi:MAG: lipoyl synthase [Geobacteraceae bacterium]|nr:lipoyl synthase [Geobacteraceae bacterium]